MGETPFYLGIEGEVWMKELGALAIPVDVNPSFGVQLDKDTVKVLLVFRQSGEFFVVTGLDIFETNSALMASALVRDIKNRLEKRKE